MDEKISAHEKMIKCIEEMDEKLKSENMTISEYYEKYLPMFPPCVGKILEQATPQENNLN